MTRELAAALARVIERAKAPPATVDAKRKTVDDVKGQIQALKLKLDNLNDQPAKNRDDSSHVRQKSDLTTRIARLQVRLNQAQTALREARSK